METAADINELAANNRPADVLLRRHKRRSSTKIHSIAFIHYCWYSVKANQKPAFSWATRTLKWWWMPPFSTTIIEVTDLIKWNSKPNRFLRAHRIEVSAIDLWDICRSGWPFRLTIAFGIREQLWKNSPVGDKADFGSCVITFHENSTIATVPNETTAVIPSCLGRCLYENLLYQLGKHSLH